MGGVARADQLAFVILLFEKVIEMMVKAIFLEFRNLFYKFLYPL